MRTVRDLILMAAIAVILATLILLLQPRTVGAACVQVAPDHPDVIAGWNPTRWRGCEVYGQGLATRYEGPGVARNDCLWPWDHCQIITITARSTGRSITVQPRMFGDLWMFTPQQKIVDLNRAAVDALGLRWSDGVYPVTVAPARSSKDSSVSVGNNSPADNLPDTALAR